MTKLSPNTKIMRVGNIHAGSVIAGRQKGEVLYGISSQYMKVSGVRVRSVTARQHKGEVLDNISSQYMKVNNI